MKTVIKIQIILCSILLLSSCNYRQVDKELEVLKKISNKKLTKLELISYINMDTVNSKIIKTSFKMKNVGINSMDSIFIKGICSCTTFTEYKKKLFPNEEQTIGITIDLAQEKGNFLKEIFLYGTFYEYQRKIQIIGYRK